MTLSDKFGVSSMEMFSWGWRLSRNIPSVLTSFRVVITGLLFVTLLEGGWGMPLFALACLTDVLDGAIARRLKAVSELGGVLDASADFLLVFSTSTLQFLGGHVPIWFLALLIAAFMKYVVSRMVSIIDPLGKHTGTILFIALGTLLLFPSEFTAAWVTGVSSCYILASIYASLTYSLKPSRTRELR